MVRTQAMMRCPATPQRTAVRRLVEPTPKMQAVIVCVVLIGAPRSDAPEMTIVPIRLTELSSGTDYRPVIAGEADSERIFKRILKLSSNMSGFVNGTL